MPILASIRQTTMSQPHVLPESCSSSPHEQHTVLVPSQRLSESPILPSSFPTMINLSQSALSRDQTHLDRLTSEFWSHFPLDNRNAQNNMDHIISLERSLLSDYVCCGVKLSDFHALLEHFEDVHIMVLAPNGRRIYPAEGLRSVPLQPVAFSESSTPSSSRSSSVMSSPLTPTVPLTPSTPTSGTEPSRKSSLQVAPVYTPFTPSLPIDPSYPYPENEITAATTPGIDFSPETYPMDIAPPHMSSDEDEEMSDSAPDSPIPTYIYGPDKKEPIAEIPTLRRRSLDALAAQTTRPKVGPTRPQKSSARSKQAKHASTSRSGKREKTYHCTKNPRCVKSYLNPNGLKYHLEKGTCTFEGEGEGEAEPEPLEETNMHSHPMVGVEAPSAAQSSSLIAADAPGTNSSGALDEIQRTTGSFVHHPQSEQSRARERCFEPPHAVSQHSQNFTSQLHESEEAPHQRPHPQEYTSYPQGQAQQLPRSLPPPPQLHINTHHPSASAYLPKAGGLAYMPRPQHNSGHGMSCSAHNQNDTRVVYAPTPLKAAALITSPRTQ